MPMFGLSDSGEFIDNTASATTDRPKYSMQYGKYTSELSYGITTMCFLASFDRCPDQRKGNAEVELFVGNTTFVQCQSASIAANKVCSLSTSTPSTSDAQDLRRTALRISSV